MSLSPGDFGFARDLAPESLAETWVGSPLYMAPEILTRDGGGYDAKADLWSVGCILFELVMGRQPYGSRAGNHMELIDDIKADRKYTPSPPIKLSEPCSDLLDRLLQRLPAQRLSYDDFFAAAWFGGGGGGGGWGLPLGGGEEKAANNVLSLVMSQAIPSHQVCGVADEDKAGLTAQAGVGVGVTGGRGGGAGGGGEGAVRSRVSQNGEVPQGQQQQQQHRHGTVDASAPNSNRVGGGVERKPQQHAAVSGEGGHQPRGSEPRTGLRRSISPPIERLLSGDNGGNNSERSIDSGGDFEMVRSGHWT